MTIVARPVGRGKWAPVVMRIAGRHLAPFTVKRGERFTLGGVVFRVVEVKA